VVPYLGHGGKEGLLGAGYQALRFESVYNVLHRLTVHCEAVHNRVALQCIFQRSAREYCGYGVMPFNQGDLRGREISKEFA
jgi:hypothetical protein